MIENIGNGFDINLYRDLSPQSPEVGTTGVEEAQEASQGTINEHFDLERTGGNKGENADKANDSEQAKGATGQENGELSEEEKGEVQKLKAIDRKVRQHEMAHLSAAAGIAVSGANFEYKRGPDGVQYAVGGDVTIDVSKESDPDATIDKARRIAAAALAPSDPSPQDRQVAARARVMETDAQMELAKEKQEEAQEAQKGQDEALPQSARNGNIEGINNRPHPGIETYKRNQSAFGGLGGAANAGNTSGTGGAGGIRGFTSAVPTLDLFA